MTAWQQRLGTAKELDRDQRRLCRRLTGGVSQPCDRLLVTPLCAEHQVIRHVQSVAPPAISATAASRCRRRRAGAGTC